jgi:pimeloyl-ACP methyl ester carboxylesterase
MPKARVPEFETHGSSNQLVVLLHAYRSNPERLCSVRDVVNKKLADADILIPRLPTATLSMADPNTLVKTVLRKINQHWRERQTCKDGRAYEKIILVGHSIGALIARKVYIVACGQNPDTIFESEFKDSEPGEWASRVERIILLAGMNRGWSVSHHQSPAHFIAWWLGGIFGRLLWLVCGRRPLILAVARGAPFITNLRLEWLAMRQNICQNVQRKQIGKATTIQLLGSVDDIVSPEDNIDLLTGGDFIYLDVPNSGHGDVIEMDKKHMGRIKRFMQALTWEPAELRRIQVQPADVAPPPVRKEVTDVIFVIHGIRDEGHWTHKIARRVADLGRAKEKIYATETSRYGYFALLPFILPAYRRAKMEWLMDQYVESKALYPCAEFSFVGHSNGTYLLAKALEEYQCCRFKYVVLASSVVRWQYDWAKLLKNGRVQAVLNYVATADWVVAFFPKALQTLHIPDLGSAGHDGFFPRSKFEQINNHLYRVKYIRRRHDAVVEGENPDNIAYFYQVKYVRGGHGAAIDEKNWNHIAHFIVHGEPPKSPIETFPDTQSQLVALPAHVAPLIWLAIFVLVGAIGYGIWQLVWPDWLKTTLFIGYLWLIWKILTRV